MKLFTSTVNYYYVITVGLFEWRKSPDYLFMSLKEDFEGCEMILCFATEYKRWTDGMLVVLVEFLVCRWAFKSKPDKLILRVYTHKYTPRNPLLCSVATICSQKVKYDHQFSQQPRNSPRDPIGAARRLVDFSIITTPVLFIFVIHRYDIVFLKSKLSWNVCRPVYFLFMLLENRWIFYVM